MKLPSMTSLCGQILLLLSDGVPRTRAQIHKALFEFNAEKEITARIRQLRGYAEIDVPKSECRKNHHGGVSYYYRIEDMSPRVRREVERWKVAQGRIAA